MIRFLQKQKSKKGFTIVELIVVIAIIAVMLAMILPAVSSQRARINEARSAAKDFYAAIQTVVNYFSGYEGQLLSNDSITPPGESVSDANKKKEVVRYYTALQGNYPFDPAYPGTAPVELAVPEEEVYMYIMVHAWNNTIQEIRVVSRTKSNPNQPKNGMYQLLQQNPAETNTEFGLVLAGEIDKRVSFNDGYYYAKVVFDPGTDADDIGMRTVKVEYTAFCRKAFELAPADYNDDYMNKLTFGKDYVLNWNGGEVCGTCAANDTGLAGTKLE